MVPSAFHALTASGEAEMQVGITSYRLTSAVFQMTFNAPFTVQTNVRSYVGWIRRTILSRRFQGFEVSIGSDPIQAEPAGRPGGLAGLSPSSTSPGVRRSSTMS